MAGSRRKRGLWNLFEYDYKSGVVKLRAEYCPRCRSIMAFHREPIARWYCGRCHYTEYVRVRRRASA